MNTPAPANLKQLSSLLRHGEGPTLELKRSTGELQEGIQSLCAFLNGSSGMVLFGVPPDGTAKGHDVSDKTLREIAHRTGAVEVWGAARTGCSPSARPTEKIDAGVGHSVQTAAATGTLPATLTDQHGKLVRYEIRMNKVMFDYIVNGGNNLENPKPPDDTWKVRLIEEDFHRLMFEAEGM